MKLSRALLGAASVAALAAAAHAQTAPDAAPIQTADASGADNGEIVVLGFGRSRQEQEVTAADIGRLPPGSTPFKAIEKLPGVQYEAADPFGAYEWAVRISLRGFNQNQLGFTLDDVPLGDMSYGNVNGLHISRAIISENLGRTVVAQGAGALGTASTSNLGGTIQFYSDRPRDHFDIAASGTYGSDETYRGYVRLDTGDLGGVRGYVSYGYLHTDKWKGYGAQYQHQANAKIVGDLGTMGTASAFFDFSARRETDYQDISLDLINRVGLDGVYHIDNVRPNYTLAKQLAEIYDNQNAQAAYAAAHGGSTTGFTAPFASAGLAFPAPYTNVDDVYYDAGGLRNDYLAGGNLDLKLAPALSVKLTPYYHQNKGQGSWITPYAATPAGAPDADGNPITDPAPLSFRTTEYAIHRGGLVGAATLETGPNSLQIGGWYERNHFHQARRYYGLADDTPGRETLDFQEHPFATQYEGDFHTDTVQYHVEDTLKLLGDQLVLTGGWKGVHVVNKANVETGPLASGRIDAKDWFQPQVSVVYHVTRNAELFADYTENMRAFVSALTSGPFSTTQAGFNSIRGTLKPETSKTYEGGARFMDGPFQASAVGYYIDFNNRLAAFANGSGIAGNPAILNNVGSVHAYGAELSANYRLTRAFSLFANYSYNHSEYQDDVVLGSGAIYAHTAGKTVIDAPRHMIKGEVVYDDGTIFGRIGGDYMSKRYFSYEDDQIAPGRFVADASVGYRFGGSGFLKGFAIEGSVTNLTNKKYISTVNTNNVEVRGSDFDNPNFMLGAPRQWFITLKKDFR